MSEGLSSERVSRAVCLAREAMESYVTEGRRENPGCMEEVFYERIGVLLKLKSTRGRGSVRGSAASYKRDKQLSDAIVDAAVEASSNKSRSEIKTCEIDTVSVTICFLETIDRIEEDYVDRIEPGEDGLIIEKKQGSKSGWMLPTLPAERGWGASEFLDRTCCKAGVGKGSWKENGVEVKRFRGQIFTEKEPGGEVERVDTSQKEKQTSSRTF